MEIKDIIPKALASIETSARPTKANRVSTPASEKFDFGFDTRNEPQLAGMLTEARTFCAEMDLNMQPRWLSLLGSSGAGKTHLAKRITRFFNRNCDRYREPKTGAMLSRRGGFVSWRKVSNDIREGDYSIVRDLGEDWFVCLDDIGAEHETQFIVSKLDELADARVGKWTVVTANLSLQQISEKETRIASRMLRNGSVVVDVDVMDWSLR